MLADMLLVAGIGLMVAGLSVFAASLPARAMEAVSALLCVGGLSAWLHQVLNRWTRDREMARSIQATSGAAAGPVSQLFGEYSPYVVQAAEDLGRSGDASAVPALLNVLETCVDMQRPGWREVAEALAEALGKIGDPRALPALYRLENVRGIGFIPAIRQAISVIEPRANLLRAGTAPEHLPGTLLRSIRSSSCEVDPHQLLHVGTTDSPAIENAAGTIVSP